MAFPQHYEDMFMTYLNASKSKLELMKPKLIAKYKNSPHWSESLFQPLVEHHRIEDSYYLTRKYKRATKDYDYSVSTGDELDILGAEEMYAPLFREFQTKIEKEDALKQSGFDPAIVDRIGDFI